MILSSRAIDRHKNIYVKNKCVCKLNIINLLAHKFTTVNLVSWQINIQGIHKRMVRFQKLQRNLFLTLHGHDVHHQQRQLSNFLMRYQQFASHAYCGAAGPVSKMASQQENAFCVLRFEVSRSVITVQQYSCGARFRKDALCIGVHYFHYNDYTTWYSTELSNSLRKYEMKILWWETGRNTRPQNDTLQHKAFEFIASAKFIWKEWKSTRPESNLNKDKLYWFLENKYNAIFSYFCIVNLLGKWNCKQHYHQKHSRVSVDRGSVLFLRVYRCAAGQEILALFVYNQ